MVLECLQMYHTFLDLYSNMSKQVHWSFIQEVETDTANPIKETKLLGHLFIEENIRIVHIHESQKYEPLGLTVDRDRCFQLM